MRIPTSPPTLAQCLEQLTGDPDGFARLIRSGVGPEYKGRYRHWDNLKRRAAPADLSPELWWAATKLARASLTKPLPLLASDGTPFQYSRTDGLMEMVHRIDRDASGRIEVAEEVTNPETRDQYLINSLIEEAITSSQIEGAATTRRVAKEMIRTGRSPRNVGERMVLNNFEAMEFIQRVRDRPLDVELILELHAIVCHDTVADSELGRIRTKDDILVLDVTDNTVLHHPPADKSLEERLQHLCDLANDRVPDYFMHPVVRSVLLHFGLAYHHPFVDGNGRVARALFYWSMLRQGFWLTQYLSISRVIKKAPVRYARSFLYTETDENDATYFVLYHLDVLRRSIDELHAYLAKSARQVRQTQQLLRRHRELNPRQIAVLNHALRHPGYRYTIRGHRQAHRVAYQTARTDLLELARRELLEQARSGKALVFHVPTDLAARIESVDSGGPGNG